MRHSDALVDAGSAPAMLVNTTTLRLRYGRLSLSFEPLPWPGASTWDAAAFDQLYCTAHGGGHNGGRASYTVHARTLDGETLDLVEGVSNQIDALGIEKELEEALGLEDREVAEEV